MFDHIKRKISEEVETVKKPVSKTTTTVEHSGSCGIPSRTCYSCQYHTRQVDPVYPMRHYDHCEFFSSKINNVVSRANNCNRYTTLGNYYD